MKQFLLTFVVLSGLMTMAHAQENSPQRGNMMNRNPEEQAKEQVTRLDETLKFTEAQKDSVYKYSLTQAQIRQELFKKAQGSGDDRSKVFAKMQVLQSEIDKKINSVLDDDQKSKYDKIIKKRDSRMQEMRK